MLARSLYLHGKQRASPAWGARYRPGKWSFAELQALVSYKATLAESHAVKVDADYTSKACAICGHTTDENRPNKGMRFGCQQCGYTLHADLIGARNVTLKTLLITNRLDPILYDPFHYGFIVLLVFFDCHRFLLFISLLFFERSLYKRFQKGDK